MWSQFLTWKSVQPLWVMHFAPLLIPTLSAQPPLPTSWRRAALEPLHSFGMFNHPTFTRTWPSTCWGIKPNFTSWPSKTSSEITPHSVGWNPHTKAAKGSFDFLCFGTVTSRSQAESFHTKLQINSFNRNPPSNSPSKFLGQSKKDVHDCWHLLRSDHFRHPCFIPLGLRV